MKQAIKLPKIDPVLFTPSSPEDGKDTIPLNKQHSTLRPQATRRERQQTDAKTEKIEEERFATGFLGWLKRLTIYLGAVVAAGTIGLLFFWQIPAVQELPELLEELGQSASISTKRPSKTGNSTANKDSTATKGATATTSDPAKSPETAGKADPDKQTAEDVAQNAAIQAEVDQLLVEAQKNMDSRRLTTPESDNALFKYQQILELQPGNPDALNGIQRITAHYRGTAERSLRQGQVDQSLSLIRRGLSVDPDDITLINLRNEAQIAKQRQQEREHEQALVRERERKRQQQLLAQKRERERKRQKQAAIRAAAQRREAALQQQRWRQQKQREQQAQKRSWFTPGSSNNNNSFGGFNQR